MASPLTDLQASHSHCCHAGQISKHAWIKPHDALVLQLQSACTCRRIAGWAAGEHTFAWDKEAAVWRFTCKNLQETLRSVSFHKIQLTTYDDLCSLQRLGQGQVVWPLDGAMWLLRNKEQSLSENLTHLIARAWHSTATNIRTIFHPRERLTQNGGKTEVRD